MENRDTPLMMDSLLQLRQAAREADPPLRGKLDSIWESLAGLVGPTVRAADAARLLGVSEPSLKRWLDTRDIASVLTPRGRREIPLGDLLDLVEEVDRARESGSRRPLSSVLRERTRRAEAAVDIDRLLPQTQPRTHRTAELQALAYHRLVAERLDDHVLEQARRRLDQWKGMGRIHSRWSEQWESILSRSLDEIKEAISADTPEARQLRQTSPFAGMLTEQERRLLTKAVAARASQ
jgi:hypothetical protein